VNIEAITAQMRQELAAKEKVKTVKSTASKPQKKAARKPAA
jgi:hypothetical protein